MAAALDGGTQVISFVLNFVCTHSDMTHVLLLILAFDFLRLYSEQQEQPMPSQHGGATISISPPTVVHPLSDIILPL